MKLEFKGTLKADFVEDFLRRELIIEIYDTDISTDSGYQKVGQISGWYYNTWDFGDEIMEMLAFADGLDGDEFQILEAVTAEDKENLKNVFAEICHIFITIDRLYILKEYRNKGYATEAMKNIKYIISVLFKLEPSETIVGLIASPFELNKEEADLDLSFDNMSFDGDSDKLMELYKKAEFKPTKLDETVFYK